MRFQRPRGTQDLLPAQAQRWQRLDASMRHTLEAYGYGEIRTPVFEETQLFVRSVGSETDIVQKEMYTFNDRRGRSLTLRPEGTASVVRAYLENHLGREAGVRRFYYLGPMFRYDRPQAGRFREFFQVGAEAIGSGDPEQDIEIIDLLSMLLHDLGLKDLEVEVNSVGHPGCRQAYESELRAALERERGKLCATCGTRIEGNPLRVFDCKNEACRGVMSRLPLLRNHLCDACETHHATVLAGLARLGIPHKENPMIVRGLDYYTRTAFEVHYPPLGAQSALGGGGRYDGLVEACGGPPTPAVGFSAGIERVLFALEQTSAEAPVEPPIVVLPLGDAARVPALELARELRAVAPTAVDLSGRSLKALLRSAGRGGAHVAVILGDKEMTRAEVTVRDLLAGEQETSPRTGVTAAVQALLQRHGGEA
ncbi:MAG: histidine--tRNA ligase [Candidatus Latescibacterota bacterium]|nr:MAG: histidine--tRNA ligase [Candidatus Latescibacterota bacterium]